MQKSEAKEVFQEEQERPEVAFADAIRDPNAMVIKQLNASLTVGTVIDLVVIPESLATFAYFRFIFGFQRIIALWLYDAWISNSCYIVTPKA